MIAEVLIPWLYVTLTNMDINASNIKPNRIYMDINAGPIRNKQIVQQNDILIAFLHSNSKGTYATIRYANSKPICTYVKYL